MAKTTRTGGPSGGPTPDNPLRPSNSIAAVVVTNPATDPRPGGIQTTVWVGGATAPAQKGDTDLWFPSARTAGDYSNRPDLVAELLAESAFYIAHRGCGDEAPEHTEASYRQSLSRGYAAVEMSGQATADGVAVCMHDTTLDRTTSLSGNLADFSLAQLRQLVVDYGAAYNGDGWAAAQPVPILGAELALWAHRGVVFLEPKAATTIVRAASARIPEVGKTVIWKFNRNSDGSLPTHAQLARELGMRLWIYMDDSDTTSLVTTVANSIGAGGGALGFSTVASDALIAHGVATGLPVVVYPIRRRAERDHYAALGVTGFMCTNISYVNSVTALRSEDGFGTGARMPGDLLGSESIVPSIVQSGGEISLPTGTTSSIGLGSLCPVPNYPGTNGGYKLTWDMKWVTLPGATLHADVYFGHVDDTRYAHQITTNVGGYHTVFRANGQLQLFRHDPGTSTGTQLGGATISTASPQANTWMSFEAIVTNTQVTLRRVDDASATITSNDTTYRGGYLGLAAASTDQAVRFRNFVVTEL